MAIIQALAQCSGTLAAGRCGPAQSRIVPQVSRTGVLTVQRQRTRHVVCAVQDEQKPEIAKVILNNFFSGTQGFECSHQRR